jgi:hypothetical protein
MKTQYNLRIDKMNAEELADIDRKFTDAGWIAAGINRTIGSHSFRVYQWEQVDVPPVYPVGFEQHKEPVDRIELDRFPRPVDDQ